jgi:transcriptional regulator with XRE-family HTH domain
MKGLGERIRSLRKIKRLTIVEVAKATGIDQATLSRIENGRMTGTLDSHRRIAEALGVRLTELYDSVMQQIAQAKDRKTLQKLETFSHSGGAIAELLTTGVLQKKMMPVLLKLKGKGRTETEELALSSERFVYVLKGSVSVILGSEQKVLNQGESLYFSASLPHHFANRLKSESRILSIITPTSL